jgi:hypothetical protein
MRRRRLPIPVPTVDRPSPESRRNGAKRLMDQLAKLAVAA